MTTVLNVVNLHKSYGRGAKAVHANDGIFLRVEEGQIVGLLGHNGAGKTTLVNQVVGLLRPDDGSITLAGIDAIARPDQARRLASVQAQANVPITGLSPKTAINLVGRMRGGQPAQVRARTNHLIEALELTPWANTVAEKVSGGVARLTAFAMAAVVPGCLLVLDEPTNDVDPVRRRLLWSQIRALADEGVAVLLVTHNVREAEHIVDQLAILDQGHVLTVNTPQALSGSDGKLIFEAELFPGQESISLSGISFTQHKNGSQLGLSRLTASISFPDAIRVITWADEARRAGQIGRFSLTPTSLEDTYVELVGSRQEAVA